MSAAFGNVHSRYMLAVIALVQVESVTQPVYAPTSRTTPFPIGSVLRIGVARVSTRDQHPEAQQDALVKAGCERVFFTDKASGKLARRPELDKALMVTRAGDQIVVTKLDRLVRSLENLIELAKQLQERGVDLVVLDHGIDTSTAVGRSPKSSSRTSRQSRPRNVRSVQ